MISPNSNQPTVTGIGAYVDLDARDAETGDEHYSILEFVRLEDGARVVIDDRGLSLGRRPLRRKPGAEADLGFDDLEDLRRTVLDAVLPDDDDEAMIHDHPWEHLADCARARGIMVTADELRALPDYEVEIAPTLLRRLGQVPQ